VRVDDRSLVAAFYVDVNSATESGQVGTTTGSMVDGLTVDPASVQPGMYVLAVDADDNACVALVTARGDDWLQLHMDEGTWKSLAELSSGWSQWTDERVSLAPLDPTDVLRAMLQTPPKD
jgi:hypothetical protein